MFNRCLILFLAFSAFAAAAPNVLFISIDDLNTSPHIMNGETSVHTPHLERLAKKGVLFTNAHCAAPACNPSRTAVMTGLAPATSGVYINAQDWRAFDSLKGHVTLPEHFRNHGYTTMGGGKLYHASTLSKFAYTGFMDPEPWDVYFPNKTRQMPDEALPPGTSGIHTSKKFYGGRFDWASLEIGTDEMADAKVVDWASGQLSRKHEKPLFLAVGIYRPHIPFYTPASYFERHPLDKVVLPEVRLDDLDDVPHAGKAKVKSDWHQWLQGHGQWEKFVRGYNASVSFCDDMVGRLLTALESGPNADDTIVVLWSDHGYHLGQKQHWEKFALWEQTTRVPFIVMAPGVTQPGTVSAEAVSLLDLFPTLSELCETTLSQDLDGTSLVPLLKNPGLKTGRAVVTTHGFRNHAVRSDRWRYIRYKDDSEELYDQRKDPKNFTNLAMNPEFAAVKEDMAQWLPRQNAGPNGGPTVTSRQKNMKTKGDRK